MYVRSNDDKVVVAKFKDTIISQESYSSLSQSESLSCIIIEVNRRQYEICPLNLLGVSGLLSTQSTHSPRSPEDLEIIGRSSTMYGLEPSTMLLRDIIFYNIMRSNNRWLSAAIIIIIILYCLLRPD